MTDEAGLRAAVAAAVPGQVIGLDGMIGIADDIYLYTPEITLTCATAGSGPFSAGSEIPLVAAADGIIVEHLVFDGTGTEFTLAAFRAEDVRFSDNTLTCGRFCVLVEEAHGAVIADNKLEATAFAAVFLYGSEDVRISDNTITPCGLLCVWVHVRSTGAVIVGNHFEASSRNAHAVVMVQGASHGTMVSRNTMRGDPSMRFGVRANASDNVVVAHNTMHGPWRGAAISINKGANNGVPAGDGGSIYSNTVLGAAEFGIEVSGDDNVLRGNRVTGAGLFAVRIRGCSSVLVGNNTGSADNGGGVLFDVQSGANSLAGNKNVVVDDGAFDCDGDGVDDPNIITGSGAVEHGANLGQLVSDAMASMPTPPGLPIG